MANQLWKPLNDFFPLWFSHPLNLRNLLGCQVACLPGGSSAFQSWLPARTEQITPQAASTHILGHYKVLGWQTNIMLSAEKNTSQWFTLHLFIVIYMFSHFLMATHWISMVSIVFFWRWIKSCPAVRIKMASSSPLHSPSHMVLYNI